MPNQPFDEKTRQLVYQIKRDPANADAWETLGDLLAEQGQTQRAEQCYRRVLALRPDDLEAKISTQHLRADEEEFTLNSLDDLVSEIQGISLAHLPLWFQVFLGLFSFAVTLLLAAAQRWQVVDLVWSLWISSLTLGFAYLFTGIAAKAIRGGMGEGILVKGKTIRGLDAPAGLRWGLSIGGALFMVAFFTVHFGMFHFVHSVFLNLFFPLVGEQGSFPNMLEIVRVCVLNYWPVVLLSALSQLPNFLRVAESELDRLMTIPYLNVVKMHISIFVFAGLNILQVDSAAMVYLLVLYFFPWSVIGNLVKRPQTAPEEA